MALETYRKFENKPLAEYRLKVQRTKWFLRRFYTSGWRQRPSKTNLFLWLATWALAMIFVLVYRTPGQEYDRGSFLVNLFFVTTTLSMIAMCISYVKGRKERNGIDAPGL